MKVVQKIINVISIALIALSVLALLTVVITPRGEAPNFFGFSFFRVTTGSMEPEIPVNSMIVVKHCTIDELNEGDVISFYSNDPTLGGAVNTHRVEKISTETGVPIITTKGDNNLVKDEYPVYEKNLIGKVVGQSKMLGVVQRLASNPLIFVPIIVIPLLILLISNLIKTVKYAKNIAKEEENAALKEALELLEQNEELKRKKLAEAQAADAQVAGAKEADAKPQSGDGESLGDSEEDAEKGEKSEDFEEDTEKGEKSET